MESHTEHEPSPGKRSCSPRGAKATYWIQERSEAGIRAAKIHVFTCRHCGSRRPKSAPEEWHGPFSHLPAAHDASAALPGIAVRSECQCVRKFAPRPFQGVRMLEEFAPQRKEERVPRKKGHSAPKQPRPKFSAAAPDSLKKRMLKPGAGLIVLTVILVAVCALSLFPSLALDDLHDPAHPYSTSFSLFNQSPLPVKNVSAECRLDFKPGAVHLRDTHLRLSENLGFMRRVTVPCFQTSTGLLPQSNGLALQVNVTYAAIGHRHVTQTFTFQAARDQDGIYRWVYER